MKPLPTNPDSTRGPSLPPPSPLPPTQNAPVGDVWALSPADTQALKGIAICLMLWHHLFQGARALGGWTWWWGRHGNVCVALFLLLSGYGMLARYGPPLSENGFLRFCRAAAACWLHRAWNLYRNYWAVFIPALLLGPFVFHRSLSDAYHVEGIRRFFCLAVDFFAFGGYRSYNVTWWFYRLILVCYALFPFWARAVLRHPWLWLLSPLLLTPAFNWTGTFCREWIFCHGVFAFGIGMLLQTAAKRWGNLRKIGPGLWAVALALAVAGFWIRDRWSWEGPDGLLAAALTMALLPILRRLGPARNVLLFLGKHSMNVFMVHTFFTTYFCARWMASLPAPWIRFAILLALSLAVSLALESMKRLVAPLLRKAFP